MLQIQMGQTLKNQRMHIVTFTCEMLLTYWNRRIMGILKTGTSALTKTLNSTPHGGGPDANSYALQEIKIEQGEFNAIRRYYWTINVTQK